MSNFKSIFFNWNEVHGMDSGLYGDYCKNQRNHQMLNKKKKKNIMGKDRSALIILHLEGEVKEVGFKKYLDIRDRTRARNLDTWKTYDDSSSAAF